MTTKYINITRDKSKAEFVRVLPAFDNAELSFQSDRVNPNILGHVVPMVKGQVRLTVPTAIELCGETCGPTINEMVKLEFNLLQGAESLSALRDEIIRVMDIAIDEYQFANAIVPPTQATFASE